MAHIAIPHPRLHWPRFHWKETAWSAVLAVVVIGALLVAWWFAGPGSEGLIFEDVNSAP